MTEEKQIEPKEKHIPVIEKTDKENQILVKVGKVAHPMLKVEHKDLNPGDNPQAFFEVEYNSLDQLMAKEHCNLHGTWQSDKEEAV